MRVNAIAPTALTRMTEDLGLAAAGKDIPEGQFNPLAAENISPLVVWLGSPAASAVTGRVFVVVGGTITVTEGWVGGPSVTVERKWEPGELTEVVPDLVAQAAGNANMFGVRA